MDDDRARSENDPLNIQASPGSVTELAGNRVEAVSQAGSTAVPNKASDKHSRRWPIVIGIIVLALAVVIFGLRQYASYLFFGHGKPMVAEMYISPSSPKPDESYIYTVDKSIGVVVPSGFEDSMAKQNHPKDNSIILSRTDGSNKAIITIFRMKPTDDATTSQDDSAQVYTTTDMFRSVLKVSKIPFWEKDSETADEKSVSIFTGLNSTESNYPYYVTMFNHGGDFYLVELFVKSAENVNSYKDAYGQVLGSVRLE